MKIIAIFAVIFVFVAVIDCRHVQHKKKHLKDSNSAKKTMIEGAHSRQISPGCCSHTGITDPFFCCQAPHPPPCCSNHVIPPFHVPQLSSGSTSPVQPPPGSCCHNVSPPVGNCCHLPHPPPCCSHVTDYVSTSPVQPPPVSCCHNVSPPVGKTGNCCQSSHPPPCCSHATDYVTIQGCCSVLPTHPDQYGCCHGANQPPCCLNLRMKAGEHKNITLTSGGKNYVLSLKLYGSNNTGTAPTPGPTKSTPGPTNATSGSPTPVPTDATVDPTSKPSTGTTPGGTTKAPTSSSDDCQQKALTAHNDKRDIHNSPPMTLDPELNKAAQEFATKLAESKQVKHSTNQERPGQGENLAKYCTTTDDDYGCDAAVNVWYKEVSSYDFGSPGYYPSTGHFTQVVWKASTKLGMGKALYVDEVGKNCYVVVGRYQAAGNVMGEFPENVERGSFTGI